MWIGCLGPLTAILMLFHGSKKILNSSLASLMVMSLPHAFGSDFRYVLAPKLFQPICISGNALRTHSSVIVTGRDGNGMFGCEKIKHVWCKCWFRWQRDVSDVHDLGCLQLFWGFRIGVWECFGTMWCSTSMDFICRDLNQCQLCTVLAKKVKWHAFYP